MTTAKRIVKGLAAMSVLGYVSVNAVLLLVFPLFCAYIHWQAERMALPLLPGIVRKLELVDQPHYGHFVAYDHSLTVVPYAGFVGGWEAGSRVRLNALLFENLGAYVDIELRNTADGWRFERDFKVEHYAL